MREFTPSKPLNWRAAKQVTTDTGRSIVKGRLNTLKGLILSKSPSKGVGLVLLYLQMKQE